MRKQAELQYLKHLECPRQCRCLGVCQSEEEVDQRFSTVFLKHDLLAGFRSLCRRGGGFPLLARVLDQALPPTEESWRLFQKTTPKVLRVPDTF